MGLVLIAIKSSLGFYSKGLNFGFDFLILEGSVSQKVEACLVMKSWPIV